MEVIERKENPLLDRVEIRFLWNHDNSPTPSLKEMVAAAARAEPGAKQELVFVKEVSTRYGRPQTTGLALVYGSSESAALESKYVRVRKDKRLKKKTKSQPPAVAVVPEPVEETDEKSDEGESEDGGE